MNNKIFTLKQLASIFDISRRTMLYYEEIEILIPSYISKTGYRYYSENEYFRLKYIIRLRKLGFDLDNIKKIILIKENNILMPLLRKKKAELKSLMKTIDDFLEEGNFRMIHADECYYIEETQPYLDWELTWDSFKKMIRKMVTNEIKPNFNKISASLLMNGKKDWTNKKNSVKNIISIEGKNVHGAKKFEAGNFFSYSCRITTPEELQEATDKLLSEAKRRKMKVVGDVWCLWVSNTRFANIISSMVRIGIRVEE